MELRCASKTGVRAHPRGESTLNRRTPFLKVFERSNDFLATGDSYQFPSLLKAAKREAWFVGTTFYITTDQYHDQLLAKLSEGVDLNFLVLSPNGQLTDNGIQFCDLPKNRSGPPARWQTHMFDLLCRAHGIEHQLTKPLAGLNAHRAPVSSIA